MFFMNPMCAVQRYVSRSVKAKEMIDDGEDERLVCHLSDCKGIKRSSVYSAHAMLPLLIPIHNTIETKRLL